MICPRRPTTRTRSFPSLRMVAIRTAALNFSVTMSRRTERFAGKGLYLIVCCLVLSSGDSSRARFPWVRARGGSSTGARVEGSPNRLGRCARIGRVHDGGNDRDPGDAVSREQARILRGNTADRKHGEARTFDDLVEKMERQDGLFGFRRTWEKRTYGQVIGARGHRGLLVPRLAIDCHAYDRPRSQDQSRGPRRRILAAHVDTVRAETPRLFRVVVHEKRYVVSIAHAADASGRLGPFLGGVNAFVPQLHDRVASFERLPHNREESIHRPFRGRHQIHAAEAPRSSTRAAQVISPERARLKAIQNGSRSAGRNTRPRSQHGRPFFVNVPMSTAGIPFLWRPSRTFAAAPGSVAIKRVPSLIASRGSMPNSFETPATAGSTRTFDRSTSTPRPEAWAISQTAFRTPPSVASCIAQTPWLRSPTEAAAASASSTVLMDSNRARAREVISAPSFRFTRSGKVFARIAVASNAAVFVTRRRLPGRAMSAVTQPTFMAIARNVAPPTIG